MPRAWNRLVSEFAEETLRDIVADLEAFASDVRPDVCVEASRIAAATGAQRQTGFVDDMRDCASPTCVNDGERRIWGHDDHRKAIGEIEQGGDVSRAYDDAVTSLPGFQHRLGGLAYIL